jgi:hypothetical protein
MYNYVYIIIILHTQIYMYRSPGLQGPDQSFPQIVVSSDGVGLEIPGSPPGR